MRLALVVVVAVALRGEAAAVLCSTIGRTGITRIDLSARLPGVGGIRVAGAGAALHMPELPFPISAPLVLQLRADGGKCWQTTYPMGNIGYSGRLTARGGQP